MTGQKKETPFDHAHEIRQSLLVAIKYNLPLEISTTHEETACLQQIPARIYKENNFQMLIVNRPDGTKWIKSDSAETAMTAFRNWRADLSDEAKSRYNQLLYRSLYEIAQAAAANIPPQVVNNLPALLLMLEAEYDKYLVGIAKRYADKGDMDIEDGRVIHGYLRSIWSQLPAPLRDNLPSPDTLFRIL